MLTDAALKALKPKDKMYKVTDRDGMYVRVAPSGALSFRLNIGSMDDARRSTWVNMGEMESRWREPGSCAWMRGERLARVARRPLKSSARSAVSRKRKASASSARNGWSTRPRPTAPGQCVAPFLSGSYCRFGAIACLRRSRRTIFEPNVARLSIAAHRRRRSTSGTS
jgi:hypothetical protein